MKKRLLEILWESPVITSWVNLFTQSLSVVFVLPLILIRFNETEVVIFLLANSFVALQGVFQLGFTQNISRLYSYIQGGARLLSDLSESKGVQSNSSVTPNLADMRKLSATSAYLFGILGLIAFFFYFGLGYYSFKEHIFTLGGSNTIWASLVFLGIITSIRVYYGHFVALETGIGNIAYLSRLQTLCSAINVLLPGLLAVSGAKFWLVLASTQVGWLIFLFVMPSRDSIEAGDNFQKKVTFDWAIVRRIFPSVWRSGFGQLFGMVSWHLMLVSCTQFYPAHVASNVLLTNKVLQAINGFSIVPLTSRLPELAKNFAAGNFRQLTQRLQASVWVSSLLNVVFVAVVLVFGSALLGLIGKNGALLTNLPFYLLALTWYLRREGTVNLFVSNSMESVYWHIAALPFFFVAIVCWTRLFGLPEIDHFIGLLFLAAVGYYATSVVCMLLNDREQSFIILRSTIVPACTCFLVILSCFIGHEKWI